MIDMIICNALQSNVQPNADHQTSHSEDDDSQNNHIELENTQINDKETSHNATSKDLGDVEDSPPPLSETFGVEETKVDIGNKENGHKKENRFCINVDAKLEIGLKADENKNVSKDQTEDEEDDPWALTEWKDDGPSFSGMIIMFSSLSCKLIYNTIIEIGIKSLSCTH